MAAAGKERAAILKAYLQVLSRWHQFCSCHNAEQSVAYKFGNLDERKSLMPREKKFKSCNANLILRRLQICRCLQISNIPCLVVMVVPSNNSFACS